MLVAGEGSSAALGPILRVGSAAMSSARMSNTCCLGGQWLCRGGRWAVFGGEVRTLDTV